MQLFELLVSSFLFIPLDIFDKATLKKIHQTKSEKVIQTLAEKRKKFNPKYF